MCHGVSPLSTMGTRPVAWGSPHLDEVGPQACGAAHPAYMVDYLAIGKSYPDREEIHHVSRDGHPDCTENHHDHGVEIIAAVVNIHHTHVAHLCAGKGRHHHETEENPLCAVGSSHHAAVCGPPGLVGTSLAFHPSEW